MCLDYTLLDPSGASLHAPALQTSIIPCTPPPPCASYGHPERRGQAGLAPQHAESTKETAAVWGRQAAEHKTAQKCCPHQCSATSCWGASESRGISVQLSRETREVLQAPRAASFTQVLLLLSYTATHSCSKENQIQPVATLTSSLLAAILLLVPTPRAAHSSPRRPAAGLRRCCLAIPTCLTSASAVPGMLCVHRPPSRR